MVKLEHVQKDQEKAVVRFEVSVERWIPKRSVWCDLAYNQFHEDDEGDVLHGLR